jgi:prepilin-type N-terminal cleavage/methylation domain-containing protein
MISRVRRGFTLIELLVVIGIIGVLVAIGMLGFAHFDKISAENVTKTRLQMCASLLTQYDPSGVLLGIEGPGGWNPTGGLPQTIYSTKNTIPITGNPGNVASGSGSRNYVIPDNPAPLSVSLTSCPHTDTSTTPASVSYPSAVQATGRIMQLFSRVPELKVTFDQLPANSLMLSSTGGTWIDPIDSLPLPVILDAWRNPIIYVPSGGMHSVYLGGVVPSPTAAASWKASVGVTDGSHPLGGGMWATKRAIVRAVDGRPFFASAGPDGNFSAGDDNMYSAPVTYTDE